jgi:hypothetical protein
MVTLDEMKQYLRVDFSEDDGLISSLITSATRLAMDVARTDDEDAFFANALMQKKLSFLPSPTCMSTERTQTLSLSPSLLRALLEGSRKEGF